MRHFAESLKAEGINVIYIRLDDPENGGSIEAEKISRVAAALHPDRIITTEPGEYRLLEIFEGLQQKFSIPVEIRTDDRFMTSRDEFSTWAEGRKSLRMEFFYREARRRYNILMEGDDPIGGQWNFDSENRQPPAQGLTRRHLSTRPPMRLHPR